MVWFIIKLIFSIILDIITIGRQSTLENAGNRSPSSITFALAT